MVLLIVKMDEFICKLNNIEIFISWAEVPTKLHEVCKTQSKCQLWKFSRVEKRMAKNLLYMRLVFDPRVGLKRFFKEV